MRLPCMYVGCFTIGPQPLYPDGKARASVDQPGIGPNARIITRFSTIHPLVEGEGGGNGGSVGCRTVGKTPTFLILI